MVVVCTCVHEYDARLQPGGEALTHRHASGSTTHVDDTGAGAGLDEVPNHGGQVKVPCGCRGRLLGHARAGLMVVRAAVVEGHIRKK